MLTDVIRRLSNEFVVEGKNSPNLMEDMASMEKYMAESYGERIFIELLQNADDAKSSKIKLLHKNDNIYFANNGRPFEEEDIISISRSGASSKKRGATIGYRGVGFKSTSYLTNQIIIHSNNSYFSYSKDRCANALNVADFESVPTIRIPFLINESELNQETLEDVEHLKHDGFSTIFVFSKAKVDLLIEEMKLINNGYFLFLNHIKHCEIELPSIFKMYTINRVNKEDHLLVSVIGEKDEDWCVFQSKKEKKIDIAFKLDFEGNITSCSSEESLFHCYLPTLEKTGYPFKVNCDFSTDPSRKHLTLDDETEAGLKLSAEELFKIVKNLINLPSDNKYNNILSLFKSRSSFSKFSNLFSDEFSDYIKNTKWLTLNSGEKIPPSSYTKRPRWLEKSEFVFLRINSLHLKYRSLPDDTYELLPTVEEFLEGYTTKELEVTDWLMVLKEEKLVREMNQHLLGKIYGNLIKKMKLDYLLSKTFYDIGECYICFQNITKQIKDISKDNITPLSNDFSETVFEINSRADVEWFEKMYDIFLFKKQGNNNEKKNEKQPATEAEKEKKWMKKSISKWRAAEQQCVELEEMMGNTAKDVSKQNLGYDVESLTQNNQKRFIEVKALPATSKHFTMTNNEYSAAHQYSKNYYLCIIIQSDSELNATYIQDPVNTLNLEKRVRQWEWYCDEFNGDSIKIELK